MTKQTLELDGFLPYLVNRAGQRFVADFTPSLAEADVDVQMWRVMSVLYTRGEQSAGRLSALTSINLSTLSRLVGRMAEKGLITRERQGEDARSVLIRLTDEGCRRTRTLIPAAIELERSATADFSEAEQSALKALLVKLYRGMSTRV
jgi:DNA-binding MarR family transcriptional regulator